PQPRGKEQRFLGITGVSICLVYMDGLWSAVRDLQPNRADLGCCACSSFPLVVGICEGVAAPPQTRPGHRCCDDCRGRYVFVRAADASGGWAISPSSAVQVRLSRHAFAVAHLEYRAPGPTRLRLECPDCGLDARTRRGSRRWCRGGVAEAANAGTSKK